MVDNKILFNNPIAYNAMNIWYNLISGNAETRYMHRSPRSNVYGNIYPQINKQSKDTFITINNYKYNVPYGDLWGYYRNGYYYNTDCTGLVRHLLFLVNPILMTPFNKLSPLVDIEGGIVRDYPRARTFYTLFTEESDYKYNIKIRKIIIDLRKKLISMGWIFFIPSKDFSNLKSGDIMVKNLKIGKNTGHMAIYISNGVDSKGKYIYVIESSSSNRKVKNLNKLIQEYNINIPKYKIHIDTFNKHGIKNIKELRNKFIMHNNTDTLINTEISNILNLHQTRGLSALLSPNGGVRLSKWRWSTVRKYIIGRVDI